MGGYVYWWNRETRAIVAMAELGDPVPANTDGLPFVVSVDLASSPGCCTCEPGCVAEVHMLCCPSPGRRPPPRREPLPDPSSRPPDPEPR